MKFDLSEDYDRYKAKEYFDKLMKDGEKIDITKKQVKRTLNQNSYFHACCGLLAQYSGYTIEEIKKIIKDQLEFMKYTKNNHEFYRSSADLNKEEFSDLIEFTISFGAEHGCNIPSSEDYLKYSFEIDKDLQNVK